MQKDLSVVTSRKIIVKTAKYKIHSVFTYISCGENKIRLIELMFETISNKNEEVLEMLVALK